MIVTKKRLASRALGVGVNRIRFNVERLKDIQNAITKQDIRDLVTQKAIFILPVRGRRTQPAVTKRRRAGSIKKRVRDTKQEYVLFVRRLRAYLMELLKQEVITKEQFYSLRKELRARKVATKAQLKMRIKQITS